LFINNSPHSHLSVWNRPAELGTSIWVIQLSSASGERKQPILHNSQSPFAAAPSEIRGSSLCVGKSLFWTVTGQNVTDVRRHLRGSGVEVLEGDRSYIYIHKTKQQVVMYFGKDVTRQGRAHGKVP